MVLHWLGKRIAQLEWHTPSDSHFRRLNNAAGMHLDRVGAYVTTPLWLLLIVYKPLFVERLPWYALRCMVHPALTIALTALAARRPDVYIRHREVCVALSMATTSLVTVDATFNGGLNLFDRHGGNGALVLLMLCVYNGVIGTLATALYTRLHHAFMAALLPALAVAPLLSGGAICGRVLRAPGAEEPLGDLFLWLDTLHVGLSPVPTPPAEQCLAANSWAVVVLGVALPLVALRRMEHRRRAEFEAQLQRSGAAQAGEPVRQQLGWQQAQHAQQEGGQPRGLLWLYWFSGVVWHVACGALAAWRHFAGALAV